MQSKEAFITASVMEYVRFQPIRELIKIYLYCFCKKKTKYINSSFKLVQSTLLLKPYLSEDSEQLPRHISLEFPEAFKPCSFHVRFDYLKGKRRKGQYIRNMVVVEHGECFDVW